MAVQLPHGTRERLLLGWQGDTDPTVGTVEVAVVAPDSPAPTDDAQWHPGSWEETVMPYQAVVMVGPGTPLDLAAGTWEVYSRITVGGERVVRSHGRLTLA